MAERIMNPEQRAVYNALVKQKRQGAADNYKAAIAAGNDARASTIASRWGQTHPTPAAPPPAPTPEPAPAPAAPPPVPAANPSVPMNDQGVPLSPLDPRTAAPAPDPVATVTGGIGDLATGVYQDTQNTFDQNIQANRFNQTSAYGSRQWVTNPDGSISIVDSLDPKQQGLLDSRLGVGTQASNIAQGLLGSLPGQYDPSSLDAKYAIPQVSEAERARIEEATYARLTRDVDRQQQQATERKAQELANRGIPIGSKLYSDQMREITDQFDRARSDARQQAVQLGGQEMQRSVDMGLNVRGQAFNEYGTRFSTPTNIAGSLANMGPQITNPDFAPIANVEKGLTDFAGIYGIGQAASQFAQQFGLSEREFEEAIKRALFDQQMRKKEFGLDKQVANAQIAAANRQGSGGGGGGQPEMGYPSVGGVAGGM